MLPNKIEKIHHISAYFSSIKGFFNIKDLILSMQGINIAYTFPFINRLESTYLASKYMLRKIHNKVPTLQFLHIVKDHDIIKY